MLWFIVAVVLSMIIGLATGDFEPMFFSGLIAMVIALFVNICMMETGDLVVRTNEAITGPVDIRIVNDEASYVFTAGNKEYALAVDEVETKVTDGPQRYVVKDRKDVGVLYSVMDSDTLAVKKIVYITPSK